MPFGPGTYGNADFSSLQPGGFQDVLTKARAAGQSTMGFGAPGLSMARPAAGASPLGNPGGMPATAQGTPALGAGMTRPPLGGGIPPQVLQMLAQRAGGGGMTQGGGPNIGALLALLAQRSRGPMGV